MTSRHLVTGLLILMMTMMRSLSGLQCYECGLYVPPEGIHIPVGTVPGKIYPCLNLTINHLKECKSSETSCMKYVNAGLEVRSCAESCIEDNNIYSEREIHCCEEDGCNRSNSLVSSHVTLILFPILAAFLFDWFPFR